MNIAIAGYGAEGISNYHYFAAAGHHVTIVDERPVLDNAPVDAPTILGEGAFGRLKGFDMVVRTAGLAPRKITTDGTVWSATNEFFANCPAPIIGVTGSKGKGTTCSLIASILREAGHTVHLIGNIGVPALDVLGQVTADDIVVYEMSSFQLWDAQYSPQVAVMLHIEPDHLDVHADFEEYVSAKENITRYQTMNDIFVCQLSNHVAWDMAQRTRAVVRLYNDSSSVWHSPDGWFYDDDSRICETSVVRLPGGHNLDNACAAIAATRDWVQDGEVISRGLGAFTGLPHRLKYVREVNGVRYFDDSIATTPGSAIAAVRAFEAPKVMVLGGSGKGASFDELATVLRDASLRHVLLIGDEAPRIAQALEGVKVPHELLGSEVSMSQVVQRASQVAMFGDVVVLSPACASFGMFKNYADRGDQFVAAVEAL